MKKTQTKFRWLALGLLCSINFLAAFGYTCVPPLFTEIIEEITLTKAQMGTTIGIVVLASILFSPIGGVFSDKAGCRWAIGAGVILAAMAGFFRGYSQSFLSFSLFMFLGGAGMYIVLPSGPKVLGSWFSSDQLAFVNGLYWAGFGLGGAAGTALSASMLSPLLGGWRMVMIALGAASLGIGILWMLIYRDPVQATSSTQKGGSEKRGIKDVFRVSDVRMLALLVCVQAIGYKSIITFLPVSLEERGILHPGEMTSLIYLSFLVFNIPAGKLSDKLKMRKPLIFIGSVISGLAVFAFSTFSGIPLAIALIVFGMGAGAVIPILLIMPVEMKKIGPELAASAVGLILMLQSVGGFLGPILSGKMIDLFGSYPAAYIFMGCTVMLSGVFILPVMETARGGREEVTAKTV